jgi:DNA-3-methyladenine glycosylase II
MKSLALRPVPPFRLDLTVWALRRRPTNSIDRWDGNTYRRMMVFGDTPAEVSIIQTGSPTSPELRIWVDSAAPKKHVAALVATVEKILGLKIDLTKFYRLAEGDDRLHMLVQRFAGIKPPRFPTIFEALVNAVACQQLSLNVGINVLNRLSAMYGRKTGGSSAFPRPTDLSDAGVEDLRKLGLSYRKAENILAISRAAIAGQLNEEVLESLDDISLAARLQEFPGVGRWTAQYVSLRGLGRFDVFPADDVGAQNKLRTLLKLDRRPDYETINAILNGWSPYKGLIYFHMILDYLREKNYFEV